MAARHPFVCWMVATVFERCYRYRGYGKDPPRLTPFYVNILMVQMNRRLQFYYDRRENELVTCLFHFQTASSPAANYCCSSLLALGEKERLCPQCVLHEFLK